MIRGLSCSILSTFLTVCLSVASSDVRDLRGIGDYREILVSWESPEHSDFQLRYCELQAWGAARCKEKVVNGDSSSNSNSNSSSSRGGRGDYRARLEGLRMATNYSVTVQSTARGSRGAPGQGGTRQSRRLTSANTIIVQTKGFSAKAVSCLPEVSEVEIETGPYFQGRIGVESGGPCAVEGDPTSPRTTYLLRIRHKECDSQVNETAASTFILVQESSHILTHSTRRFLVLCTFQPETLTVRAGLSMPETAEGTVEQALYDLSANEVHASPLKRENIVQGETGDLSTLLGGVAALLGVVVIALGVWRRLAYQRNGRGDESDSKVSTEDTGRAGSEMSSTEDSTDTNKIEENSENEDVLSISSESVTVFV